MGGRPNNKGPTIKAIILAINTKLDGAFCSSGEVNHAISRADKDVELQIYRATHVPHPPPVRLAKELLVPIDQLS
ncbi:hypothetical protein PCASD_23667 [Puccinia coronata f. sp. avenae]|uniref:Uncharacterized protein n=1 Tax=Puccinia coronata f. sp. avenae TaxID=200324 RepID=A0A2N5TL33_9BASI|nr:hypothetical protein PCASD_23667 [Puccinia coronata f. sp. avenae]